MFYNDCTKHYATEVIKEIIEYAENDSAALDLIRAFMDSEMSVEDIQDRIF